MAPWKKNHESVCTFTLGIITQFPKVTHSSIVMNLLMERGPILSTQEVKASFLTNPNIAPSGG